jgi:hypothetical protein
VRLSAGVGGQIPAYYHAVYRRGGRRGRRVAERCLRGGAGELPVSLFRSTLVPSGSSSGAEE